MDERAFRAARHESRHAAAAGHYRWPILHISRTSGWDALTELAPPRFGDITERALEAGVVLLMPMLADRNGCGGDLQRLTALLEAGTRLSSVWDAALELEHDPDFIRRRRAVECALITRPILTREEIAELL